MDSRRLFIVSLVKPVLSYVGSNEFRCDIAQGDFGIPRNCPESI